MRRASAAASPAERRTECALIADVPRFGYGFGPGWQGVRPGRGISPEASVAPKPDPSLGLPQDETHD